jgi:hypothetical protein
MVERSRRCKKGRRLRRGAVGYSPSIMDNDNSVPSLVLASSTDSSVEVGSPKLFKYWRDKRRHGIVVVHDRR